jgi:hypothetical protein
MKKEYLCIFQSNLHFKRGTDFTIIRTKMNKKWFVFKEQPRLLILLHFSIELPIEKLRRSNL